MSERFCKACGCTEERACVTESGPCHWGSDPALCSACEEQIKALMELKDEVVGIRLNGCEAFQLLAALQLACRHPKFTGEARAFVENFAGGLQERISVSEIVADLCERGWTQNVPASANDLEESVASLVRERGLEGAVLVLFAPNKRAEVIAASCPDGAKGDNFKERLAEVLENLRDGTGMPLGNHGANV